jgi:hypothetical protein
LNNGQISAGVNSCEGQEQDGPGFERQENDLTGTGLTSAGTGRTIRSEGNVSLGL